MRVITISGKAQHGKDTTASIIKEKLERLDHSVLIIHYADMLKYICKEYFGWNGVKDEEGRRLLQHIGTDVIRSKDEHFWVDSVRRILSVIGDCFEYVLIPDTRFPNEVYPVTGWDDTTELNIRVQRSNRFEPFDNGLTQEQKLHESETALDNYVPNIMIANAGDIDELKRAIDDVMPAIISDKNFLRPDRAGGEIDTYTY